jgi:cytochrome b pre-mRNA-processing protein 3
MILSFLFAGRKRRKLGEKLFSLVREASRNPDFFGQGRVPDSVDGRFDILVLHSFLLMRSLRDSSPDERLDQLVFDAMFRDLDTAVRELGTSDTRVGKKIKAMAVAYYGRVKNYHDALSKKDAALLQQALQRNIFGDEIDPEKIGFCEQLTSWLIASEKLLAQQSPEQVLDFGAKFAPTDFS